MINGDPFFMYCAIDSGKKHIKIGISSRPDIRIEQLEKDSGGLSMKLIYVLEMQARHSEFSESLNDDANFRGSTARKSNYNCFFGSNPAKKIRKIEKLFLDKFKGTNTLGSEWFSYSSEKMNYIKQLLLKIEEADNTAITRCRLVVQKRF